MTGAGLSRIPRGRMVQASEMARRTLERLEALRDEPVGPVQVARDTGLPRVRTATRDQFEIAIGWMRRVRIGDVGDELAGWIGTADIEIGYDEKARHVLVQPSLSELHRLCEEPRRRVDDLRSPAPIHEFELLRVASVNALTALVQLHEYEVRGVSQLTPRAFEDGSYAQIANDFMLRYQPTIDACIPPANALLEVLDGANTELDARELGGR